VPLWVFLASAVVCGAAVGRWWAILLTPAWTLWLVSGPRTPLEHGIVVWIETLMTVAVFVALVAGVALRKLGAWRNDVRRRAD
jgi:hypothetical protein